MYSKKNNYFNNYRYEFLISSLCFFILSLLFFIYLFSIAEKNSYFLKYEVKYDEKLIDKSTYKIFVSSKFNDTKMDSNKPEFLKCGSLEICNEISKKLNQEIKDINNELTKTIKKFLDEKIPELENKIALSNIEDLINTKTKTIDMEMYLSILNLEFIRNDKDLQVVKIYTEIINNKWKYIYTQIINYTLINFIFSLCLFMTLSIFKPIRNKFKS